MMRPPYSFPKLPLEEWEDTQTTLHLYLQIVGKALLYLMPYRIHWWNITFRVNHAGLISEGIPHEKGVFYFQFDFVTHEFRIDKSWGRSLSFPMENGLSISTFYNQFFTLLDEIQVVCKIKAEPYDHPCTEAFPECETHHSYDSYSVEKFHQILVGVDRVFKEFAGKYIGKVSPSQLFWHHVDLAVARFSGKQGPDRGEGASAADQEAYSHEVISAGFWMGDQNVREPAFYCYTYPAPADIENKPIQPDTAFWDMSSGSAMAMLFYKDVLSSEDPQQAIMDFLESAYKAGADLGEWPQ